MVLALGAWLVTMLVGPVQPQRIEVPEGWYQVEEGSGETPDSEIFIQVEESDPAPPQDVAPEPAPDPGELSRLLQVDCEEVRGRYLQRILELHGVSAFVLDARALAAWTRVRPPGGWLFGGGALADPALAPLWGEPPIPPGALAWDFTLQQLARDLLSCPALP